MVEMPTKDRYWDLCIKEAILAQLIDDRGQVEKASAEMTEDLYANTVFGYIAGGDRG